MRAALDIARALGVEYTVIHRTDELGFTKSSGGLLRVKSTRKDAPRALLSLLRQRAAATR